MVGIRLGQGEWSELGRHDFGSVRPGQYLRHLAAGAVSSRSECGLRLGEARGSDGTALYTVGEEVGEYEELALIVVAILGWVLLMRLVLPRLGVST